MAEFKKLNISVNLFQYAPLWNTLVDPNHKVRKGQSETGGGGSRIARIIIIIIIIVIINNGHKIGVP